MAFLEVKGLKAFYRQIEAIHGLDFSLEEGSITTILGANGAGKTTTLRAICRMVRTEGEIRFDGQDVTGMATEKVVQLGIAHVPEGRGTFVRQSVEENLQLGAYTRKSKTEIAADVERVYDYFPRLRERQKQQAGTLSGGEQQMLAIGRALMLRPRLMLLDEPSLWSGTADRSGNLRHYASYPRKRGYNHAAGGAECEYRAEPGRSRLPAGNRQRGDVGEARSSAMTKPCAAAISAIRRRKTNGFISSANPRGSRDRFDLRLCRAGCGDDLPSHRPL